ncbi:MAG: hypothetical protein JOY54_03340 [Acidobacteriaceae bacterium]|nr:hypothetical protein [Acidobacteriaceae bacterium]
MPKSSAVLLAAILLIGTASGQETPTATAKPSEHVIGTITAVDTTAHTITVREDKTGAQDTVQLANTKTLIKVAPGAKDLKSATRITADDLAVGDRVDVRGSKPEDDPNAIAARSVVLMSARELQAAHQAQAEAWRNSTAGIVDSIDPSTGKLTITVRTPEGRQPVTVETSKATEFTRYTAETPGTPAPSSLAQIQPHDQVRIIGEKNADGSTITAEKLYSGAFRTLTGTILSIAPDGKQITIKNLATKQPVQILLNDESAIRKLPPMMAMTLARRLNPNFRSGAGAPPNSGRQGEAAANSGESPNSSWQRGSGEQGQPASAAGPGMGMHARGNGDVSQMIEHLPKINLSDLKPGDEVVVAGAATGADDSRLLATNIIAGVEPILQSAPTRQGGQSLGGDWGLGEMAVPQ